MSAGYVYVLTNPSMPGIVKIGRSKHGGRTRARDLYKHATGVPSPYRMEFEIWCEDCVQVEADVHEELSDQRVNPDREFFHMRADDAIEVVMRVYGYNFNLTVSVSDLAITCSEVLPNYGPSIIGYISDKHPDAPPEYVLMAAMGEHLEIEALKKAVDEFHEVHLSRLKEINKFREPVDVESSK